MNNYFLTTSRLAFRPWTIDDLPLATALWGDLDVTRFVGGPFSEEQIRQRLEREIANQQQHGIQYWPIFERTTNNYIGCCGLRPYPKAVNTLELGFHLRPSYWRQGIAKEAAEAVIKFAFDELKVAALFAGHNPKNEVSRYLLARLGFEYTHDEFYPPTGLQHPSYLLRRETRSGTLPDPNP